MSYKSSHLSGKSQNRHPAAESTNRTKPHIQKLLKYTYNTRFIAWVRSPRQRSLVHTAIRDNNAFSLIGILVHRISSWRICFWGLFYCRVFFFSFDSWFRMTVPLLVSWSVKYRLADVLVGDFRGFVSANMWM